MSVRFRPLIALALCAGLAGGLGLTSASAAAKPVCNLLTDPKGDATGDAGAANDPVMDIISADVASNAKKITAVLRVQKLAATSVNYPLGISWRVNFVIGDTTYTMSAISDRSGLAAQTSYADPTTKQGTIARAPTTVVLDTAKSEVRITASAVAFGDRVNVKPGTLVTGLGALTVGIFQLPTNPVVNGNLSYTTADTATGGKDCLAGTASCVVVGK